jgi:hypothetical protein
MKPSVYIETTIVSYLTAWPSSEPICRAHQVVTERWWRELAPSFSLYTSQFVLDECSAGDPMAAKDRLIALSNIQQLELNEKTYSIAESLLEHGALPLKARLDAFHVAAAAASSVEYLLTWNCKHLANATMWDKIEKICLNAGFRPPRICTPLELGGGTDGT